MNKKQYQPPRIEVIRMENEGGVMAGSGNIGDFNSPTPMLSGTTRSSGNKNVQSSGPLQELEDIINDILTVKR